MENGKIHHLLKRDTLKIHEMINLPENSDQGLMRFFSL
jgi:hypothetical protein